MPSTRRYRWFRILFLVANAAASAIFADGECSMRKFRMEIARPSAERTYLLRIPAKIAIVGADIGNHRLGGVVSLTTMGVNSSTRRICGLCRLLNRAYDAQHVGIFGIDLIAEAPHDDRGMIEILRDQFAHLLLHIVLEGAPRIDRPI